jgi:hypothetical protein
VKTRADLHRVPSQKNLHEVGKIDERGKRKEDRGKRTEEKRKLEKRKEGRGKRKE